MSVEYAFATSSNDKYRETADYIPRNKSYRVVWRNLIIDERAGFDLELIVKEKLRAAFALSRSRVFVDHTSLAITALKGIPGPQSSFFWTSVGPEICDICRKLGDATANVTVAMAYTDGTSIHLTQQQITGKIADSAVVGTRPFSWDQVFIPDGSTVTFSSLTISEKNSISPRAKALNALMALWDKA